MTPTTATPPYMTTVAIRSLPPTSSSTSGLPEATDLAPPDARPEYRHHAAYTTSAAPRKTWFHASRRAPRGSNRFTIAPPWNSPHAAISSAAEMNRLEIENERTRNIAEIPPKTPAAHPPKAATLTHRRIFLARREASANAPICSEPNMAGVGLVPAAALLPLCTGHG